MSIKVNEASCMACEACISYCPMEVISMKDNVAFIDEDECVECGLCYRAATLQGLFRTPCSHSCPAGIDVPRYLQFIADGKFDEAIAVIREKIPFPAICGLVCFHPCEVRCARTRLDEPVAIRMLKRFAWEHGNGMWKRKIKVAPASGKRVATIGSGPAGLTTAYYLARLGHSVTVYEALPEPGGMMRYGIPEYRLPEDALRVEIKEIEDTGVEIRTNTRVDSIDKLLKEGYHAVFVATGAHQGLQMGIKGEDSPQVMESVDFLRNVRLGSEIKIGNKVAVIGGGNSAIDAARTALRLGAKKVTVFYRRSQKELPATPEEVEEANVEGVQIHYLAAPSRISSRDGTVELELKRMELGTPDDSGRQRPVPVKGSEFTESFDNIIVAIGQRPEIPHQFNLPTGQGDVIAVDPGTLATAKKGVFAGGDVVTGPASIIEAIAAGRQAAIYIDEYLGGDGNIIEVLAPSEEGAVSLEEVKEKRRPHMPTLPTEKRLGNFKQVELGYSPEMAIEEAKRCLRCDLRERDCIIFEPSTEWPRSLRNHYSQPGVPHATTGIAGRGTEEMKTNDVTGRFKRGWVGVGIDFGRPCIGARFRDVDKVVQALAKLGVEFEPNNPVTKMMVDTKTGKLREDILNEKVMSCVVETVFPIAKLEEVLNGLREVTKQLDTVVSVCSINRAEPDGSYPLRKKLDELGIFYRPNGKQNAGLGKPRANV